MLLLWSNISKKKNKYQDDDLNQNHVFAMIATYAENPVVIYYVEK